MIEIVLAIVIGFPSETIETTTKEDLNPPASISEMNEDNPLWDCRTMGNNKCGTFNEITGEWEVVEWYTI